MTIQEKINEIKGLKQDQCWYITKHNLDFKQLCFSAQIVEEYQNSDKTTNFADFYNSIAEDYGLSKNHRATNNCYYVGLLKNNGQYKDAIPTQFYYDLKRSVANNFHNLNNKNELLISQIEKVYVTNPADRELNDLRKDFKIHPAFFLAKVLLSLGEITGYYSITIEEFYLFIGTATSYKEHHIVTQLIIENRANDLAIENKFSNNRMHLLLENLPYFIKEHNEIKFDTAFINTMKEKLFRYETTKDDMFSIDFLTNNCYFPSSESSFSSINKIYYGAPGTGKSHKVNEIIKRKEKRAERVTFHPEYDYSSFVGSYKPSMDGDNIRYEFVPQAFTNIYVKAWNDLDNDYYLVIEEINRGNCAEIFGDIFQLLDRSNDYEVTPSKELKEYLKTELSGNDKIDENKLSLPSNLNILATMNTSDQSLFPMDSAFKRRWDWEYIPINYNEDETENPSAKFKVQLTDTESFSWLAFIKSVNAVIKSNDNLGMDKCLGNYFIKPKSEIINLETFVNKAIFYLWNDVFKDETEEENIFKDKTTYEDFFPISTNGLGKVKEILELLAVEVKVSEE